MPEREREYYDRHTWHYAYLYYMFRITYLKNNWKNNED